ncbi:MAG: hypothetical protein M3Y32_00480 [Pseudomonadota bacterium]|nr:hypothetical protein [Pseudomonadota bacterium]
MDTFTTPDGTGIGRRITGIFPDRASAEAAYEETHQRGYTSKDVSLVMSDETRRTHFSNTEGKETEFGNKAAEGAGVGGAIGGTLGAIAASIAAVGTSLALPGLGLVIAGPIVAALAGAGAGAASGGLVGALIGWSIPEERVKGYHEQIKQGGILMGMEARSEADADFIVERWRAHGAVDIHR